MKIEYKVVPVVGQKVLDEAKGIIGVFVSVTGVVDSVKDRIIPGAYEKTLAARTPKMCWSHDWDKPIGKALAVEELFPGDDRLPPTTRTGEQWPAMAGALYVETQFNLDTQRGRDAFSDVKFYGVEQEYSIGYNVPPGASKVDGKTGIRELSYIDLYEYSPVLFGAMSLTQTASVKDAQEAWKVQVKEGEATEGQVQVMEYDGGETLAKEFLIPAGTLHAEATRMLAEAMNPKEAAVAEPTPARTAPVAEGFVEVTPDTPITTPGDPIHTSQRGSTGSNAGVEVEDRPLVVALSDDGEKAISSTIDWAIAAVLDEGMDRVAALEKANEQVRGLGEEPTAFTVGEAKATVLLTGSYEERQDALREALPDFLDGLFDLGTSDLDEYGWPDVWVFTEATYNARVVAVVYDMDGDEDTRYFDCAYAWDGSEAILKSAKEVEIQGVVVPKTAARLAEVKAARSAMRLAVLGVVVPPVKSTPPVDPPAPEAMEVLTEADLFALDRLKLIA